MFKLIATAALAVVILCAGCAGGPSPSAGGGSITMYGTIDQGVTVHN
ncbi:conserved exported hypothetical protein [Burkholderia sp. 8Y]|nr:hypothetical protein [Burkholderia sp. 8Y]VXC29452.1 conserved exported hypothetical protein [Burkholderia sp. 8Y]